MMKRITVEKVFYMISGLMVLVMLISFGITFKYPHEVKLFLVEKGIIYDEATWMEINFPVMKYDTEVYISEDGYACKDIPRQTE